MKTITINEFYDGMADDRFNARASEFSFIKQFDTLTYPHRLQPLRGMSAHTTGTGIGNMIVASNGSTYGSGTNSTNGRLYALIDYGATGAFTTLATDQLSGATVNYEFLVDYPDCGHIRAIHWASNNTLVCSDPAGGSSASTSSLSFTTIGQGLVHPKDKILYFPYRTSTASFIGLISPNATPFTGLNAVAFTMPNQYRIYCLSNYGDYLAIPATGNGNTVGPNASIVYLSNRDTSINTFDQSIPWGDGILKVLNNLNGVLIGISELGNNFIQGGTSQDYNSILIKAFDGGVEPKVIAELKVQNVGGAASPSVLINPRVNFIHNNRLYFSVNLVPTDGVSQTRYGLWSVGRNKITGEYSVSMERVATNANTDTGVLSAVIIGDYVEIVHTAEGTLTKSTNGLTSSTTYSATSSYESTINPNMPENDALAKKQLMSMSIHYLPLPSGASITAYYRVDSNGTFSDWTSLGSNISSEIVAMERTRASANEFTAGRNYEFRIESTGGATITSFTYRYQNQETNQ